MSAVAVIPPTTALRDRYRAVRERTDALTAAVSDAEATVQSMPDASPIKWHLGHTTWFFETFVLRDSVPTYTAFNERYAGVFNSYYEAEGARLERTHRGRLIHPTLDAVRAYRRHVDEAVEVFWSRLPDTALVRLALGMAHEEQHQELLLMDALHLTFSSPLQQPIALPVLPEPSQGSSGWVDGPTGVVNMGAAGVDFFFDCEGPPHRVFLNPHRIARALVTNEEWSAFIADGGYTTPTWWLSDGWDWVRRHAITAPLYWHHDRAAPKVFTLHGWASMDPKAPVRHVSYYEADAYARWFKGRLPTEQEMEAAVRDGRLSQAADSLWQWTASAYAAYPGFWPTTGALGEYNGKFMSGQQVLRGGSFATPPHHTRPTYRNYYHPHQRWAFTGVRLAQDR